VSDVTEPQTEPQTEAQTETQPDTDSDGRASTRAHDVGGEPSTTSEPGAADPAGAPSIQLYWRPGCGFCSSLTRSLDRIGLDYDAHDIWDDEDAAVFVRSVANGNETVPTVRIGDVALVNPTADEVMAEVATIAPARVPADYEPPEPGALGRALRRMLGG
jgi:mycoredoxin